MTSNPASSSPGSSPSSLDSTINRPMRVLVTGGTGLVGSAVKELIEQSANSGDGSFWFFAGSKDADLRDYAATVALFERFQPTHVLHLAALVGGLFRNMRQKVDFWRDNMRMNENVLECARQYKVHKVVSSLSTCIFPDRTSYPITEAMLHNGPPHPSNEGYAYAKRMLDVLNRCYHEQYGCMFTAVIPTNIYGPRDNFSLEDGHVIPGLIHKCYQAKLKGEPFTICGTGKPLRQFIYSSDLAKLLIWAIRSYEDLEPLILSVSPEAEVSIEEVARLIAQSLDYKGEIKNDLSKADGQYRKTADNSKLQRLLPGFQFTPIEEGIRATCSWFMAHYATCRK